MLTISHELPWDAPARDMLLMAAFGEGRFRKTAEKLRAGRLPAENLAFSLKDEANQLIGTLRFWHIQAGTAGASLLLGPIAIAQHRRAEGLGTRLMHHGLEQARLNGHKSILLVGDSAYYGRFGFSRDLTRKLDLPGPVEADRFLGLELVPQALANASGMLEATGQLDQDGFRAFCASSWRR